MLFNVRKIRGRTRPKITEILVFLGMFSFAFFRSFALHIFIYLFIKKNHNQALITTLVIISRSVA